MCATHINLNFYLTFGKKKLDWVFRILSLLGSVDGNVKSLKRTEKNWRSESGLGSIWMLKPDAQFKNLTCSSNLEPQGNASRFERSGSINNHVQEEKVKTDTGKSWGVSISITDKILAQVPLKGAPDKRHQGPKESQWGVSTSVQSGRRDYCCRRRTGKKSFWFNQNTAIRSELQLLLWFICPKAASLANGVNRNCVLSLLALLISFMPSCPRNKLVIQTLLSSSRGSHRESHRVTDVQSRISAYCLHALEVHMQYTRDGRIHLAGVCTTLAERKGISGDAKLASSHHVPVTGEKFERFHCASTWRYVCVYMLCVCVCVCVCACVCA